MRRFLVIAITLALAASVSTADSEPAQSPPMSSRSRLIVTSASEWPVPIRVFWEQRSAEVRRIGGDLWFVRTLQQGERLAEDNILKQAYRRPEAPNYVRLRDGHKVSHLAYIAADLNIDGLHVAEGRVEKIEGDVMTFGLAKDYGYTTRTIIGLSPEQVAFYSTFIPPKGVPIQLDRKGHLLPHAPLMYTTHREETPGMLGKPAQVIVRFKIADIPQETVAPEELRAWCLAYDIVSFPDPRPIPQAHDRTEKVRTRNRATGSWRTVESTIRTYTFTWSNHDIPVPQVAR